MLKTAIIGTGFMGRAHAEALRRTPGVEIVAIASGRKSRAEELVAEFGIPRATDDWRPLMADADVDVIHNCTPNNLHYEINRAALKAGKHIISEKPLTTSASESKQLLELAERSGTVHAVNFNYRFYPLIQHARAMVEAGEIGDIRLIHGHYVQDWLLYDTDYNWRLESNVSGRSRAMADIGSHWTDLVQFVSGLNITRVSARLKTVYEHRKKPAEAVETFKGKEAGEHGGESVPIDTEDAALVLFELENGGLGTVTISQVSPGRKNHQWFEIDGSEQALAWQQENPNELWIGHRGRPNELLQTDASLLAEDARRFTHYPGGHPEGYPDGFKNMCLRVYDFIREGKNPQQDAPDFPTFKDGYRANRVVDAVLKSNEEGRWVEV